MVFLLVQHIISQSSLCFRLKTSIRSTDSTVSLKSQKNVLKKMIRISCHCTQKSLVIYLHVGCYVCGKT